jgi:hypothetical protein
MLAPLFKDNNETAPYDVVRHEVTLTCRRAAFIPQADQGDDLRFSRFRLVLSWSIALAVSLLIWWAVVRGIIALIAVIR